MSSCLILVPYLERLIQGRRVAVLGDALSGLASALSSRGARLVHVYDPQAARVAQAITTGSMRGVTYAHLTDGDLGVRAHAFDMVVIPDLSLFATTSTSSILARSRQLTSAQGVLAAAIPNSAERSADGGPHLGYYELYDALSLQFPAVRMVGQVPFQGYALVDFARADGREVSVDTSLLEGLPQQEPELFIGFASERPLALDSYAIVQLPPARQEPATAGDVNREAPAANPGHAAREALQAATRALVETQAQLQAVRTELGIARQQEQRALADTQSQLEAVRTELTTAAHQQEQRALADTQSQLEAVRTELTTATRQQEQRIRDLVQQQGQAQRRTGDLEVQNAQLSRAFAAVEEERKRLITRVESLSRELEHHKTQLPGVSQAEYDTLAETAQCLSHELAQARAELAAVQEAHSCEIITAEAALRERAREITLLRHEVDRRGMLVRELLHTLEEVQEQASDERSSRQQAMAPLQPAQKSIDELANPLQQAPASSSGAPLSVDTDHRLATAQAEIDALRQALLQERQDHLRQEQTQGTGDPESAVLVEQLEVNRRLPVDIAR